jgi:uncharacterized protein (TIGR03435 family)
VIGAALEDCFKLKFVRRQKAMNRELGLRLESREVLVSFFVIESAQKPSEN